MSLRALRPSIGAIASYGLAKLIPGLIVFVSILIWIREYGVSEYGQYSLVWAVSTFASALFVGWIRQSILRGVGDARWSIRVVPVKVHLLALVTCAVPVVIYAGLSAGDRSIFSYAIAAAAFSLSGTSYTVMQAQLQREGLARTYATTESMRVSIALGVTLLPIGFGPEDGASVIMNANIIAYVVGCCACLFAGIRSAGRSTEAKLTINPGWVHMWRYGWPLSLWLVLSLSLVYIDRFIVALLYGEDAAGQYIAVADLIGRGMPILAFPITMAIHPLVMRQWNLGQRAIAMATVARSLLHLSLLLTLLGAILVAFAPPVIRIIAPSVQAGTVLVMWLVIGSALWQVALLAHKPFEFAGRTRSMLSLIFAAVGMTVIMDVILVPKFGPTAAAFSFAMGALVYCASSLFLGTRSIRSSTYASPRPQPAG